MEPALERTASSCTPAFLPQPGAGFHPLPWGAAARCPQQAEHIGHCQSTEHISPIFLAFPLSALTKRITGLPTDTPLLLKPQGGCAGGLQSPEGQWDVSHGRAGTLCMRGTDQRPNTSCRAGTALSPVNWSISALPAPPCQGEETRPCWDEIQLFPWAAAPHF